MKLYVYIHICCGNNWRNIFEHLMNAIRISGLYNIVDEFRCVVLGDGNDPIFQDPKIRVMYTSMNYQIYEFKIMELLYEDSLKEDFNVLYLHTKGIKHYNTPKEQNVKDWVNLMMYYMIYKHVLCLEKLEKHDVIGVNFNTSDVYHFSGNFWWSKSQHIRTLGPIVDRSYNSPEYYITTKKEGSSYLCLWHSGVNHYEMPYSSDKYVGKLDLKVYKNYTLQKEEIEN